MPPIDPLQLLKALSPLLATDGGIRSVDEVARLASLMKKFSRKLVSKCVYVNVLVATKMDIVHKFLEEGGWETIHSWLLEAKDNNNVPFLLDLLRLFHTLPMTVERLKQNNSAKMVRTFLKSDVPAIKKLAAEVVETWIRIIKGASPDSNESVNKKKKENKEKRKITEIKKDKDEKSSKESKNERDDKCKDVKRDEKINKDNKKDKEDKNKELKNKEDKNKELKKEKSKEKVVDKSPKHRRPSDESKAKRLKTDDKNKHENKSGHKTEDRPHKPSPRPEERPHKSNSRPEDRPHKSSPHPEDRPRKSSPHPEDRPRKTSPHPEDRPHHNKLSPRSDTQNQDNQVKDDDLEDVKFPAFLLDPEPKKPKPSRPKTVKLFQAKFRSLGMEEEETAPKPPVLAKKPTKDKKTVPPLIIFNKSQVKRQSSTLPEDHAPEKKAKPDFGGLPSDTPVKPGGIKLIPPQPKPTALLESSMFMDAIMANPSAPTNKKKKKSTNSPASKAPTTPTTPTSPTAVQPKLQFYKDTMEADKDQDDKKEGEETKGENSNEGDGSGTPEPSEEDDDVNKLDIKMDDAPEPIVALTEEEEAAEREAAKERNGGLVSVLSDGRKKKVKKSVRWVEDSKIKQIFFFEMDETERVNVNNPKNFGDLSSQERFKERQNMESARRIIGDKMEEKISWVMPQLIDDVPKLVDPGCNSLEKETQRDRELSVLQEIYFTKQMLPDSPYEPDVLETPDGPEPKIIPLDDESNPDAVIDYTHVEMPAPVLTPPPPPRPVPSKTQAPVKDPVRMEPMVVPNMNMNNNMNMMNNMDMRPPFPGPPMGDMMLPNGLPPPPDGMMGMPPPPFPPGPFPPGFNPMLPFPPDMFPPPPLPPPMESGMMRPEFFNGMPPMMPPMPRMGFDGPPRGPIQFGGPPPRGGMGRGLMGRFPEPGMRPDMRPEMRNDFGMRNDRRGNNNRKNNRNQRHNARSQGGRGSQVCRAFTNGQCRFGPDCMYLHPGVNGPDL